MNDIRTFTNTRFGEVRTVMVDSEPWFVAADVCRALDVANSRDAVSRLDDDEKDDVGLTDAIGREQRTTIINEPGLYALVLGSRKPEARAFKRWITHEVIPSIRKYGAYATPETLDRILGDPEFGIRLLSELKAERERRQALEEEAAENEQLLLEMRPKVSYVDMVLQNKRTVPITAIAKDYGMSARAMNSLLHKLGVQYRLGSMWVLYQPYADKGYTQSATDVLNDGKVVMFTCWTQKGRLFLYNLLKDNHGLLPVIEREATDDEGLDT